MSVGFYTPCQNISASAIYRSIEGFFQELLATFISYIHLPLLLMPKIITRRILYILNAMNELIVYISILTGFMPTPNELFAFAEEFPQKRETEGM